MSVLYTNVVRTQYSSQILLSLQWLQRKQLLYNMAVDSKLIWEQSRTQADDFFPAHQTYYYYSAIHQDWFIARSNVINTANGNLVQYTIYGYIQYIGHRVVIDRLIGMRFYNTLGSRWNRQYTPVIVSDIFIRNEEVEEAQSRTVIEVIVSCTNETHSTIQNVDVASEMFEDRRVSKCPK